MQGTLLGAIHGLEQHIDDLFAQWNHGYLLEHAEELLAAIGTESVSTDAAAQQPEAAQASAQADSSTSAEGSYAEHSRPKPSALHGKSLWDSSALSKTCISGNAKEGESSPAGMHSSAAQPPSSVDVPGTLRQKPKQLSEEAAQPQLKITSTSLQPAEEVARVSP